jgi:GTP-binding protein YchF
MKIGLVGLPNSGKTAVFNALTRSHADVTAYATAKAEPNIAVVDVGDERVSRLSELYKPRKTAYATIDIVDFIGLTQGASKDQTMSAEVLRLLRTMDALAVVVRNFDDPAGETPAPETDMEMLAEEFLLSDLIIAEGRLERIEAGYKRGQKSPALAAEEKALRRAADQLNAMQPLRELDFSPEEQKILRGFQFLTLKPAIAILNSSEEAFGRSEATLEAIGRRFPAIEFAGAFEMELAQLDSAEDAEAFMRDMGITESARDRLTQIAYLAMGYISFFTVGEDEVRAWQIRRDSTAVEAAGAIHTDLARGFIRAECFHYDDLIACGSEKAIKERGLLRLEGKDYIVKDGDILSIRYNV